MKIALVVAIAVSLPVAIGQVREYPERGISVTGSYTVSEIETVNNVNGNLFLSIPIVQMPPGRGAYAGPVRLNYNSALFDVALLTSSDNVGYKKLLNVSGEGGWSYGFDYGLRIVPRDPLSGVNDCQQEANYNTLKYILLTPDGGRKELTLDKNVQADTVDGYYRVSPNGYIFNCPTGTYTLLSSSPLVFYTTDGSYLRLELPFASGTSFQDQTWKLYLPDGGVVEGKSDYTTNVKDANGWSVSYARTFDSYQGTTAFTITEDQTPHRTITGATPSKPGIPSTDTFTWPGFGSGVTLTTTVTWGSIDAGAHTYTCESAGTQCFLPGGRTVVTAITLPKAKSTDPTQTYNFEYRDTAAAHCGSTRCYGELGLIKLPSGDSADRLSASYVYSKEGLAISPENFDNPVKTKQVTYLEHREGTATASISQTETSSFTFDLSAGTSVFTNAAGGSTAYYFNNPGTMWDPKRGLVYRTKNPDGSEVERLWWRNRTYNTNDNDPGNPYVRREVTTLPNGSGGASRSAVKQFTIDKNGNTIISDEHNWVDYSTISRTAGKIVDTASVPGTRLRRYASTYFKTTNSAGEGTSDAVDEVNAYWRTTASRNLRALTRRTTAGSSDTAIAAVEYDYAAAAFANNVTEERHWNDMKGGVARAITTPLTDTNAVITTYAYTDCPGMVDTVTDPNGYKIKTDYNTNCLFPTAQKEAYGRSEQRTTTLTYHEATGLLTNSVDSNSIQTSYDYDVLGRRTSAKEAVGVASLERRAVFEYDEGNRKVTTKRDRLATGDAGLITVSYFDSRGINWLTLSSEDGTTPANGCATGCTKVETRSIAAPGYFYSAVSNPYRDSGDTDTRGFTLTRKDAAGRVGAITTYAGLMASAAPWNTGATSHGETVISYDGEVTQTTDPASKSMSHTVDALGHTIAASAGGLSSTANVYNALGNLTSVVQGTQSARAFTYNSLGLLIAATQPENGTTGYLYDDNGNLLKKTNANGKTVEYKAPVGAAITEKAYDGLNRPRRKVDQQSAGADVEVSWTWDTATSGKGRLASVSSGDTTVGYDSYDALGRVVTHHQTTAGTAYNFSYEHFLNDALKKVTYPSSRAITYGLDSAGRPVSATGSPSYGSTSYISGATYTPHGALRQVDVGGTTKMRARWGTYNPRLQLEDFTVSKLSAPTSTLLNLGYTYGGSANNGNPVTQSINDGSTTRNQSYTYDAANRLKTAGETSGFSQNYNFDAYNNRWLNTTDSMPGGFYTPSSQSYYDAATNRAAVNPAGYFTTAFDSAGNFTQQNTTDVQFYNTNFWDAGGQKTGSTLTIAGSPNPILWSYDGLGQRVKKEHPTLGMTVFVHDAFGNLAAEYALSAYSDCATCYLYSDPLNSTRLVTDGVGTAINRFDYMPFGEGIWAGQPWSNGRTGAVYGGPSSVKPQFTGSYRDDQVNEWGGDYFGARYFNRAYGRFLSPDENLLDQHPGDPLSWNLYSYVRNNPLRYVDPTGATCVAHTNGSGDTIGFSDVEGPGGTCADAYNGNLELKRNPSVRVSDQAPPTEGLLALANGTRRAEKHISTSALLIAGFATSYASVTLATGVAVSAGFTTLAAGGAIAELTLSGNGGAMVRQAVSWTLRSPVSQSLRVRLLRQALSAVGVAQGNWKFSEGVAADGSKYFLGGLGEIIVVDPAGYIWRGNIAKNMVLTNANRIDFSTLTRQTGH